MARASSPCATYPHRQDAGATASRSGGAPLQDSVEVTDEELFRKGDRESLAILVNRYQDGLFSLLVQMVKGDVSLADDLFQESFVRAVRAAKTFDSSKSFRTWITAIALNLVRDESRRRKLRSEVLLQEEFPNGPARPAAHGTPEAALEEEDEAQRVRGALAKLTDKEREMVLLHFYQGLTLVEVAAALDIPIGTGKSRLHSALVRLKQLLEE